MKFGKDFRNHLEETLPEWRDKFLCYKPLKKLIKHLPPELLPPETIHHHNPNPNPDPIPNQNPNPNPIANQNPNPNPIANQNPNPDPDPNPNANPNPWIGLEDWFVMILNEELEKFNDFYVDKEEDFVIRLQELKERIERARLTKNGPFTSESEFSEEMLEIRKAFVTIHGEMVLLKNYSSLNFAALVKILKKYDKRTGGLLSLPFTQRALHQPFFTTEPLTRLVRECEANLELLFPLEAEVVESNSPAKRENPEGKNITKTSSTKEDTDDVYRSTLAAMKAIQGLRKASSTYNPLSLAQFFHSQDNDDYDDDASGAVTAEDNSVHSGEQEIASK